MGEGLGEPAYTSLGRASYSVPQRNNTDSPELRLSVDHYVREEAADTAEGAGFLKRIQMCFEPEGGYSLRAHTLCANKTEVHKSCFYK